MTAGRRKPARHGLGRYGLCRTSGGAIRSHAAISRHDSIVDSSAERAPQRSRWSCHQATASRPRRQVTATTHRTAAAAARNPKRYTSNVDSSSGAFAEADSGAASAMAGNCVVSRLLVSAAVRGRMFGVVGAVAVKAWISTVDAESNLVSATDVASGFAVLSIGTIVGAAE